MSIKYAILGILSYNSFTGYELKKIIRDSSFMYWSGNNNQIYKSLIELLDGRLVTSEVRYQESSPSKKIYTITEKGLDELKKWILSSPEPPEFKKTFLIQLAWADQLSTDELNTLLSQYEDEIKMQIILQQEMRRRQAFFPNRTPREGFIWDMIYQNIISSYENELEWIKRLRTELFCNHNEEEINTMNYAVVKRKDKKYIECASAKTPIHNEQNALDLIAACIEHDTNLLMIHMEALDDDFFRLRTGLAGDILQKFINYHIKVTIVITDSQKVKGKLREFLSESNRGDNFRAFNNKNEAENWLLNL
ncbi:MAG: DUF4180 domain-containing protein [Tissierellaceae bacterium]|nr:DUF4180 domain-containing protein [Tissierellaceae bacterium]